MDTHVIGDLLDPSIEPVVIETGLATFRLCFDLRALARAEQNLLRFDRDASLLQRFPEPTLSATAALLRPALQRFHPEIDDVGHLMSPRTLQPLVQALQQAWLEALPPQTLEQLPKRTRQLPAEASKPSFTRVQAWEQVMTIGLVDLQFPRSELMLMTPRRLYQCFDRLKALDRPTGKMMEYMIAQLTAVTANFSIRGPLDREEQTKAQDFMPSVFRERADAQAKLLGVRSRRRRHVIATELARNFSAWVGREVLKENPSAAQARADERRVEQDIRAAFDTWTKPMQPSAH